MPKYTFRCEACSHSRQLVVSPSVTTSKCLKCGEPTVRSMPILSGPSSVDEVVDKYTGTRRIDNQSEIMHNRSDNYFWSVEVPRLVNTGTYSIETMIENDWISVDDKGNIQINTRPPKKR